MKMFSFKRKCACLLITLLTFMTLFSVNTFAKVKKLPKVVKQYNYDGKLVKKKTYSYDSKGCVVREEVYRNYSGEKSTFTVTYKLTYWSKTSKYLKQAVATYSSGYKIVYKYNKKGLLKTEIETDSNNDVVYSITYQNNGKVITSLVKKDKNGNVTERRRFTDDGLMKNWYQYEDGKKTFSRTITYYYNSKGKLEKSKWKSGEDICYAYYDNKGRTKKNVTKTPDGRTITEKLVYTFDADGYMTGYTVMSGSETFGKNTFTYTKKTYDRRQPGYWNSKDDLIP